MREEGIEAARETVAPKAFAFDGWSMVPLEEPRGDLPLSEIPDAEAAPIPA